MTDRRRRFEAQALPHLDAAYNLARWLARPPLDADDIVQDAVLRAWRGFDQVRGDDVKPWLLAIVRNCFLTAAGQRKRRHDVPLPEDNAANDPALIDAAPNPEAVILQNDAGRAKWGRDHNTFGFSQWVAGGGLKRGCVHGETDEWGHKAVKDIVNHYDWHATLLHCFGLDHTRLTYKRNGADMSLTDNQGARVVTEILA